MTRRPEYDDVPLVPRDAEPDPHWQELTAGRTSLVPVAYLPEAVAGQLTGWRRGVVLLLIAMLLSATAGGICLTYGPGELFALLRR